MSNVFVIINEWTANDNSSGAEIVDSTFFYTEQAAWDALSLVAQAYEIELHPAETSISLEDHTPRLQFEEYYIQELTAG